MTSSKSISRNAGWTRLEWGGADLEFCVQGTRPGDFLEVRDLLARQGLEAPTFLHVSMLAAEAFKGSGDVEGKAVVNCIQDRWLWADTALLYVPGVGVYVQDRPEATKDGRTLREDPFPRGLWMEEGSLRGRLESGDPEVRFAAFGFKTGVQTVSELESNPLVIALAGSREGAQIVAEAARGVERKPCLWAFAQVDRTILRVAALGTEQMGTQLVISARCYDVGPNGNGMCGFGIR